MTKGGARLFLATSLLALAEAAQSNETVTYSYDSLGRLTRVVRSGTVSNGVTADYAYDAADNRTNVAVSVPAGEPPTVPPTGPPTVPPAGPPTVSGGSFEAPDVGSGYVYRPTGGPAAFGGNSGITANATGWGFEPAPDGDQLAFLQGGDTPATISLPVAGLTPGASYAVTFRISARPIFSPIAVTASFDGAVLGTFNPPGTSFTSVTTAAFTAAGSSGTLTFTATAESTYFASGIDMVSIATAAASPPPGSPPPGSPPPGSPPPGSPPPPDNQPPTAVPDSVSVMTCQSTTIDVLANDSDPEGNTPLTLMSVTQGTKGNATSLRSVHYSAGSQTGTDVLTYTVRDSLRASSTGTLTVNVTPGQC